MAEVDTVSLDSLIGEHVLDGVDLSTERVKAYDESFEDANVIRFRLDGKVYTAIEDPNDGYRSSMDKLFVENCQINNTFPPTKVLGRKKDGDEYGINDTIQLIDIANGETILEVGTDHADDYYPSFVSAFWPERMAINSPISKR